MSVEVVIKNKDAIAKLIQKVRVQLKNLIPPVLGNSIVKFAETGSKFVPPKVAGQWKKTIPAKMYKRPIFYIPSLLKKDRRNQKQYVEKLRQGYKFVVIGYRNKKRYRWYATTLRNAKKYTRIKYRGLMKYLFGANIASLNQGVPSIFSNLLAKSPDMSNVKSLNKVKLQSKITNNEVNAESSISNEMQGVEFYARESLYQGKKVLKRNFKKLLQQKVNQVIKNVK